VSGEGVREILRDGGFGLFSAGKWGGDDGSDGLAAKPLILMEGRIGQIREKAGKETGALFTSRPCS